MIPNNFLVNINRSYLNALGTNLNVNYEKPSIPSTIIKLSINPVLILGGGINILSSTIFIDGKNIYLNHIKQMV